MVDIQEIRGSTLTMEFALQIFVRILLSECVTMVCTYKHIVDINMCYLNHLQDVNYLTQIYTEFYTVASCSVFSISSTFCYFNLNSSSYVFKVIVPHKSGCIHSNR